MIKDISKALKLYRIVTVLSILPRYWVSSNRIAKHVNAKSRWAIYFDLLYCLFKYGASDENYLQFRFYRQPHTYRNSFITWRRNMAIMKYTPKDVIALFLDKARFNIRFQQYVKRGWLDCKTASKMEILNFVEKYPAVIVKPIESACGVGICKWVSQTVDDEKIDKIVGANYIIEEAIENCSELKALNPSSLNTLRMVTFVDKKANVHIINVVLRVGQGNSIMDNAHAGGIACVVNSRTGRLGGEARTFKDEIFEYHPTTNVRFLDFQIPRFDECVNFVMRLASEIPAARLVGWDVVITPTGLEVLEANIPPGEDLTELDLHGKYQKVIKLC